MAFITINKTNFFHNLSQIALKTGSIDKVAIVLKDNAYGHGIDIIASLASEYGVKHAVVRDLREADAIKVHFETVLVLAGESRVDEVCTFAVNSLDQIETMTPGTGVELKVDTGMHRNGVAMDEVEEALRRIETHGLKLVGVMTHFRSADELSSDLFWQQKRFETVKALVREKGYTVRFHSHNSAATLRCKNFDEDMVRVGIAAYGYDELHESFDRT
ncbi:MAG TPA: alanine racemase, partial [Epsilonproteobacteria bacterium]|nr:alanine racemase [Campylobacterota bacterium]